jgi:hypothetical protein
MICFPSAILACCWSDVRKSRWLGFKDLGNDQETGRRDMYELQDGNKVTHGLFRDRPEPLHACPSHAMVEK